MPTAREERVLEVKERLGISPSFEEDTQEVWVEGDGTEKFIGRIRAEVIQGNVVITVEREDAEKFGPVSVVVV